MPTNALNIQEALISDLPQEPVVVVCAADDNYAMPLAVTLRSVLENLHSKWKLEIFVIDGGINNKNREKIKDSLNSSRVSLEWLDPIESPLEYVKTSSYYTKAVHHKVFIPEILTKYKKAIYLDSDLLVVSDLGQLWEYDLTNLNVLAALDIYPDPLFHGYRELLSHDIDVDKIKIFNSGVMVLNLERCRSEKTSLETINLVSKYKLPGNQVALSIVLKDKWGEIDPRWNRTAGIYEYASYEKSPFSEEDFEHLLNDPCIIHFTSADKPWNSIGRCREQSTFYHYLDMTAWSGWRFTQWKRIKQALYKKVNRFRRKVAG